MDFKPHISHKVPADLTHFWGVTVLSNSPRFKRRYELYYPFADMCEAAGVKLITVELALGQRSHMVTESSNPRHVQLRSLEELWHKENLINIGIGRARHLDPLIDKVFWSDCDLRPMRAPRDWFEETWHELQHFKFVQMYEEFMNLDSHYNPIGGLSPSFMGSYFKMDMTGPIPNGHCREYKEHCKRNHPHHRHGFKDGGDSTHSGGKLWFGPPGGAWAADISALDEIGMIPDRCIIGSGDWHLACALTSSMSPQDPEMVSSKYIDYLFEIQNRCDRWIKRDVGVVKGGIFHDNHGPKISRNYTGRKQILTRGLFDPYKDIKYDNQGVLQLETHSERQIRLRDQVRFYFKQRNEDQLEIRK